MKDWIILEKIRNKRTLLLICIYRSTIVHHHELVEVCWNCLAFWQNSTYVGEQEAESMTQQYTCTYMLIPSA